MRLAFRIRNANETMRIKPVAWWLCNSKRSSAGEYDKWPSSPSPRKLMRHTRADFAKQKRELNGRSELIGLDFFGRFAPCCVLTGRRVRRIHDNVFRTKMPLFSSIQSFIKPICNEFPQASLRTVSKRMWSNNNNQQHNSLCWRPMSRVVLRDVKFDRFFFAKQRHFY